MNAINTKPIIPIIFMIGQSNSTGRAEKTRLALTDYAAFENENPNVKIFYKTTIYSNAYNGTWQTLQPGVNNLEPLVIAAGDTLFGAEVSLGQDLYAGLGRTPYFVKGGNGGTGLWNDAGNLDWNAANRNELLDNSVFLHLHQGIRALRDIDLGRVKVAVVWHQGEHDAGDGHESEYQTNFSNFVTALRGKSPYLTNARIYAIKLNFHQTAAETTVNNALQQVCADNSSFMKFIEPNVAYPRKQDLPLGIRTSYPGTNPDDQHNSFYYQVDSGQRICADLLSIGYFDSM